MHLLQASVTLNLAKCEFSTNCVKFLGHVRSSSGIEADPEKLIIITNNNLCIYIVQASWIYDCQCNTS